jgi:hypothetical protein
MPWITSTLETDLPSVRPDSLFVFQWFKPQRILELPTDEININTVEHSAVNIIYVAIPLQAYAGP